MATKKNFVMKNHNGTDWDILHPQTNMAQVEGLESKIGEVEAIAKGASRAFVFDTVAALDTWLGVAANKATLQTGDHLYIRATDVPDYWWDGTAKQPLETQKVTLTNATQSADGLMSKADKTKLDGVATGATKVTAPSDIGAATAAQGTKADNAVPNTRKVNSKALSADITLAAGDVGAVPTTRKVNGKELSADITLAAGDVGAATAAQGAKADTALQSIPFETTAANIKGAGTASAGSSGKVADAAHVHPEQASVATLKTARTIAIGTGATGTATSFNGGANITIPITAVNADYITSGTLPAARLGVPVITVASTAPASPKTGDIWYDLSNA